MAQYRIMYWKDIPAQIEAFEGGQRVRRPLGARFQELIDTTAMRQGLTGTDAYLEGWRAGPVLAQDGPPEGVADAVAAELEAQFEEIRAAVLDSHKASSSG